MATTNKGTTASETFGTTSPVTGAAPTLATDGQPVQDLNTVQVVVDAGATTLSGAGTLQAYLYDGSVGAWARWPARDLTVNQTTRAQAFDHFWLQAPRNARIKWVPSGVTFAAGSAGVTVYQLGYTPSSKGQYP